MKNTALSHIHEALGAKMVPFAGYNMPVQYEGVTAEHLSVRENVGVFDVSHMGEFIIRGKGAFELVQKVTSNDVSKLVDGKVQYTCLPNGKGGIVDDLLVYRMDQQTYFLVVNASNIAKDWDWISKHNTAGVEMVNISEDTSLLAVQGPKATAALQSLTEMNISDMKYYTFQKGNFAGKENVLISTTGYTGAGGFEIYFKNEDAEEIWKAIFEAGKECNITPVGLAARDTLRLEMGFCLYGNDIDDTTSPLEAGLGWITKFTNDFVDSDFLQKQKEAGITKRLVGFELVDRGVPREGYDVVNQEGEKIGNVTSGTMAPSLKKAIGLAYIPKGMTAPGTEIYIAVRKKQLKAKVVTLPFYKA
ncbi:MAG: glycine cleavage system aminomethyltransferase GcvT [Flavobacteriales bacterium]|jgi:aminomethyltransferase|tara:strand:+ start:1897 stop:2979 length:1083 start_codon:yes stop_codon:yes gene_type:complete